MNQKSLIPLLSLLVLLSSACGKETDADRIADAQNCLDKAATTEAAACVAKVDGMKSSGAYLIRCVGNFVKEGFNQPSKISTALAAQTGGATGSLGMMSALVFKAEATDALNAASAQTTFNYCTLANSQGLIFLSGLVQTATTIGKLAGDIQTLTPAELETYMGTLAGNPEAQAAVGSAVVGMYQASCSNGQTAPGNYCSQFASAVTAAGGISNTAAIGEQIMICYNAPTTPGCTGF
jgi:hypothetical protein